MNASLQAGCAAGPSHRAVGLPGHTAIALALVMLAGCGPEPPPATVEGTLRLNGQPLDNCLVTFLPEPSQEPNGFHSTGQTDERGMYRLRGDNQQEGASVGRHRVTIQDLSASTGVRRRDNGTVDAESDNSSPPPKARRSRVPASYQSASGTPLRQEIKPGHQVIDLDVSGNYL